MQESKTGADQGKRLGLYLRESKAAGDKEVKDQRAVGTRWAERNGCVIPDGRVYVDNNLSASIYAKKARKEFERLCRDVEAGRLDLVWFWSLSRSQRRLDMYVRLRDLCQAKGVNWVIDGRIFDLLDPMDLRSLGMSAVDDEVFSRQLSKNVRRGLAENAAAGKPHGHATYGYRRIYNEKREYVKQVPEDTRRESNTGYLYSPAGVCSEIIRRVAKGEPVTAIKASLEEREILTPTGKKQWARTVIRKIASNKAYIGIRVHNPQEGPATEVPDAWLPIDPDPEFPNIFAKAQAILSDPKRKTTKPARARHLLTYIATGACGLPLQALEQPGRQRRYRCEDKCSSVVADDLDLFVQTVIDRYLAREDVQEFLAAGQGGSEEATAARAEVAKLREELEDWRKLADAGDVTPLEYARFSKALRGRIEEAEERAEAASVSPVIPREVDWSNLAIARQVVAAMIDVQLQSVGKGRRFVRVDKRVKAKLLVGPDAVAE